STPQLFRYERTQRGRLREHYQWNVDVIGEDDIAADAEVLAVALDALRLLGLGPEDIVARYSDRRLLEVLLLQAGVPAASLAATYAVVDKVGRESDERIQARLGEEAGLDSATLVRVLRLFDTPELSTLQEEFGADPVIARELDRMQLYAARLAELGLGGYVRFDPSIVRGLAYYTGTVFEIFDRRGILRAICGGGRYDRLLGAMGGADLPAVGFGMGDVVLTELLRDRNLLPAGDPRVDVFIVTMAESERPLLLDIAASLRSAGRSVLYSLKPVGMGRQLKEADARGARTALLLGSDEVARGAATIRAMATGEQREVSLDELLRDPSGALA
ncbi:MAG: ATP phosphoribosyltransferase regulatory subunit, partial [Gemmatimonadota bacterium]